MHLNDVLSTDFEVRNRCFSCFSDFSWTDKCPAQPRIPATWSSQSRRYDRCLPCSW